MSVVMKARRQSTPQPISLRCLSARGGKYCSQWSVLLYGTHHHRHSRRQPRTRSRIRRPASWGTPTAPPTQMGILMRTATADMKMPKQMQIQHARVMWGVYHTRSPHAPAASRRAPVRKERHDDRGVVRRRRPAPARLARRQPPATTTARGASSLPDREPTWVPHQAARAPEAGDLLLGDARLLEDAPLRGGVARLGHGLGLLAAELGGVLDLQSAKTGNALGVKPSCPAARSYAEGGECRSSAAGHKERGGRCSSLGGSGGGGPIWTSPAVRWASLAHPPSAQPRPRPRHPLPAHHYMPASPSPSHHPAFRFVPAAPLACRWRRRRPRRRRRRRRRAPPPWGTSAARRTCPARK